MKKFSQYLWEVIVHLFWTAFFFGQLLRSTDGLLSLWDSSLQEFYATNTPGLKLALLSTLLALAIFVARWCIAYARKHVFMKNPQESVDKR